jgi:predicted enzyme related to lactoylglutathione lyase
MVILRSPAGLELELVEHGTHAAVSAVARDGAPTLGYFSWSMITDDLDAAFSTVVSAGASIVSYPAAATRAGVRFAYLADPEGNQFELLQLDDR